MTIKEKVEGLLFIDNPPTEKQSKLIDMIINLTKAKLLTKLPRDTLIPMDLEYIIVEVAIKRYNRIGSEGMRIEEVEGHRMTFSNNDFDEYQDDINKWIDDENEISKKVVRFI